MDEQQWMAEQFEARRAHLRAVAYRMLGSAGEADDAVQSAWLRLSRADVSEVDNLGGWLTTVVARVSLDMLRARSSRREEPAAGDRASADDPEGEAILASSVGAALLVVLETLAPAERLAFVLHDSFAVPFEEIGSILGRSPNAAKQLAHRARLKVQGGQPGSDVDPVHQRVIVDAFLTASRDGDFDALVALLHPDVELAANPAAVQMGSPALVQGARAVAAVFSGRAQGAQPALVDGATGIAWAVGGQPKVVWDLSIEDGRVVHLDMLAGADALDSLALVLLDRTD